MLLSIHWNPDPELFRLFGSISIRYYGLLWLLGLTFAYFIVRYQYRDRRIGDDKEMVLPIHFLPDGDWKFTGYEGLSSHGGVIGLLIALWMYCRKTKVHYIDVLDMIAVTAPLTGCCIRTANLMNSEIIGKPTDVPWAFVFERVDLVARHPAQLYEALAYLLFFVIMVIIYRRHRYHLHRGFYLGLCLTEVFVFRFLIEFLKENQVGFEEQMTLNMGQWLSVPFVLVGVYFMFFYGRGRKA